VGFVEPVHTQGLGRADAEVGAVRLGHIERDGHRLDEVVVDRRVDLEVTFEAVFVGNRDLDGGPAVVRALGDVDRDVPDAHLTAVAAVDVFGADQTVDFDRRRSDRSATAATGIGRVD